MEPISQSEVKFYRMLQNKVKLIYLYENLSLLKYAVDMIPTEDLNMKATLKLSMLEESDPSVAFDDLLLLELLNWFKFDFFKWIDAPKCGSCGQTSRKRGNTSPSETEKQWHVATVELYYCPNCQKHIRFPRINHPKKLLETRVGRCGEWANCFTLLCRALGYDARLVFDWSDHVWTEVFSFSKNRWLHCDPCENICDKPLMYEIGWKKPIAYVIAFSKDEVQDVTWRYCSDFSKAMKRRALCREEWLLSVILHFINKLQANVSAERKEELTKRRILELAEFLTPPIADESYTGRSSGSLAWRIARGEVQIDPNKNPYVFYLTDKEVNKKCLHIKYSCTLDKYIRASDGSTESEGWSTCAFNYCNIFRKVETDWKMAYLARSEGSDSSSIVWKFNLNGSHLAIQTLRVSLNSETFESGKVEWNISSDVHPEISKTYLENGISIQTDYFEGCTGLIISAEMSEGSGNQAWQHTQLFRQSLDSRDFPFEVKMRLKEQ